MHAIWTLALVLLNVAALPACTTSPAQEASYDVVARYPHDPRAFTQGLLWHDGKLYESTGLYGASTLRRVDLATGSAEEVRYLPETIFAEGLARVAGELIQLTWREEVAYRWPLEGFSHLDEPLATHRYPGEGWGLCNLDEELVMSNGSSELVIRDATSFAERRRVDVTLDGAPLDRLNELECIDDRVWANIWYDDRIVRIDPRTGRVDAWIDLRAVIDANTRETLSQDAVLNGIAWRPETETLLVTGKLWPEIIEIRLTNLP